MFVLFLFYQATQSFDVMLDYKKGRPAPPKSNLLNRDYYSMKRVNSFASC